MSQPLGKVTGDLEKARGPDVQMRVNVDKHWFGRQIEVTLGRNLNCAACQGGGCDRCGRAGAVTLYKRGEPPKVVRVSLPRLEDPGQDVCLRVPGEGGPSLEPDQGPGHLMLILRPSESSDPAVTVCARAITSIDREQLVRRSLIMALVLVLLFIAMLRLSGWL